VRHRGLVVVGGKRRLLKQLGDRDLVLDTLVQSTLTRAEVAGNVDFNLSEKIKIS